MKQPPFEKLERDGKVAVLISPGFGAGWSTWNTEYPGLLFDKEIVEPLLAENKARARAVAEAKYPKAYKGGFDDLEVQWVLKGSRIKVHGYDDGSESLHVLGPDDGTIA